MEKNAKITLTGQSRFKSPGKDDSWKPEVQNLLTLSFLGTESRPYRDAVFQIGRDSTETVASDPGGPKPYPKMDEIKKLNV